MSLLYYEYDHDLALEVRYEEGFEEGQEKEREEIAKNALAEGASVEFVQKITGLDIEAIKALST
jgi:predicted transposase/invertase (TIGR01784 family)